MTGTIHDETTADSTVRSQSGRWVVVVMFAFALTVTGLLYGYWNLHTRPFRPLQEAIAAEYEGSHPLVQGGQEKMHKGTPRILRIVLRVEFDPTDDAEQQRVNDIVDRVEQLAAEHQDLDNYDKLEIHLAWIRPEQPTLEREVVRDLELAE